MHPPLTKKSRAVLATSWDDYQLLLSIYERVVTRACPRARDTLHHYPARARPHAAGSAQGGGCAPCAVARPSVSEEEGSLKG